MWADLPANMQVTSEVSPHNARQAAIKQLHYILGDNDRGSYVAGFGENPPKRNHHRDAAIAPWEQTSPDAANKCFFCQSLYAHWLAHMHVGMPKTPMLACSFQKQMLASSFSKADACMLVFKSRCLLLVKSKLQASKSAGGGMDHSGSKSLIVDQATRITRLTTRTQSRPDTQEICQRD
jgi:hypothetical protein